MMKAPSLSFVHARRALAAALLAIALLSTAAGARAQEDAANVAAARVLAIEGVKLARIGRCDDAIDRLERAEALHHSVIVLEQLGECLVLQGRLVDGTEALRKVLREPLPERPTTALRRAYVRAQPMLDRATPKIAMLILEIEGAPPASVEISIDGQAVPSELLGARRPTDPGEHVVQASAPGFVAARETLSLAAGERRRLVLALARNENAVAASTARDEAGNAATPRAGGEAAATDPRADASAAPAPLAIARRGQPAPAAASAAQERAEPNRTAAYVTWSVGIAALALGTGFGIAAVNDRRTLDDRCNGTSCPSAEHARIDAARTRGTIATAGFATAAAAGALGLVFYLQADADEAPSERRPNAHASAHTRARAQLGLTHASVAIDF